MATKTINIFPYLEFKDFREYITVKRNFEDSSRPDYIKTKYDKIVNRIANSKLYKLKLNSPKNPFYKLEDFKQEAYIELYKEYEKYKNGLIEVLLLYKKHNDIARILDKAIKGGSKIKHTYKTTDLSTLIYNFEDISKRMATACSRAITRYYHSPEIFLDDHNTISLYELMPRPQGGQEDEPREDTYMVDYIYHSGGAIQNTRNIFDSHVKIDRIDDFAVRSVLLKNIFKELEPIDRKILLLKIMNYSIVDMAASLKISRQSVHSRLKALMEYDIKRDASIDEKRAQRKQEPWPTLKIKDALDDICQEVKTIPYFNREASKPRKVYCKQCQKLIKAEPLEEPYKKTDIENYTYDKKGFCSLNCWEGYKEARIKIKQAKTDKDVKQWLEKSNKIGSQEYLEYIRNIYANKTKTLTALCNSRSDNQNCEYCGSPTYKRYCSSACQELYNKTYSEMTPDDWKRLKKKDLSLV